MEFGEPIRQPKNLDVECLRCGAFNIPENHICGRCGASLPLVYDSEGNVIHPGTDRLPPPKTGRPLLSPNAVRWVLRLGVLLFALGMAWFILHRRHP